MDLLIRNVTAVTMDDARPVIENAFIGVSGGKIVYLSPASPAEPTEKIIDGGGKLCMPGLINAHTHLAMTLMRGFADDYALQEWLFEHVFPAEHRLTPQDIYLGSMLGMAELIASGTVCRLAICICTFPRLRERPSIPAFTPIFPTAPPALTSKTMILQLIR